MATRNQPSPDDDPDATPMDDVLRVRIAQRAFEIAQSDDAGTDEENWLRAERELERSSSE